MMGFGFGGFGMILFWLIIVAIAVLAIRGLINQEGRHSELNQSASEILKRRYAAGEISREEFQRLQRELGNV